MLETIEAGNTFGAFRQLGVPEACPIHFRRGPFEPGQVAEELFVWDVEAPLLDGARQLTIRATFRYSADEYGDLTTLETETTFTIVGRAVSSMEVSKGQSSTL